MLTGGQSMTTNFNLHSVMFFLLKACDRYNGLPLFKSGEVNASFYQFSVVQTLAY